MRLLLPLLAAFACASPEPEAGPPPAGWSVQAAGPSRFRAALDGDGGARLEPIDADAEGAGTLMQSIRADAYRGRRVRFSAAVRTDGVTGWAGLWMRVSRPRGRDPFDNMQDRPLRGTTDWGRHAVVLEVAPDALTIDIGLVQDGPGASFVADAALEIVGTEVAVTDVDRRPRALDNGDFESPGVEPASWLSSGFGQEDVEVAVDRAVHRSGAASARMQSRVADPRGRGMMIQSIRAEDHRGRRLRVSAWLRGQRVTSGAFLVQVMGADSGVGSEGLSRGACAAGGSFEWRACQVVVDVPPHADTINISPYVEGTGTLWIDDVTLEPVGSDVPLTWVDERQLAAADGEFEDGEPDGWFISGGARLHYAADIDRTVAHGGQASARLAARVVAPLGYGTFMQLFRAADFRGSRLRISAFVKGAGITGRGDIWARVQGEESPADGSGLGAASRRLSGTFDWTQVSFVLAVPAGADSIQLGIGLDGPGALWIDDVSVAKTDGDVPLDGGEPAAPPVITGPLSPVNLDFKDR